MEYYNGLAAGYDELHGEEQKNKLSVVKSHLQLDEDALLLDVGCGTGFSSEFFECRIIGIDNSREMLLVGRRKGTDKIDYILADGGQLPFKDGVFDCVICVTALHNFTSPKGAIDEVKRVCSKRGALTVLKKAKSARDLEAQVDDVLEITDIIDEDFDRILFFNIRVNHQ